MTEEDLLRRINQQNSRMTPVETGATGLGGLALDLLPFGRQAEKIVTGRGSEITAGDLALEAGLTFLPFGKIAKGVAGAGKAAINTAKSATKAGRTAAKTAATTAVKTKAKQSPQSFLERTANRATQAGSGLRIGTGVGDLKKTQEAAELFTKRGIVGTPREQLKKIDETMSGLGNQVDKTLEQTPVKIDGNAVRAQVQSAINDPLKYAELDLTTAGAQRALGAHLDKFGRATSAKEVNDYIKEVNPLARSAQNKLYRGVSPTDKEMAALAAKKAGDEVLQQVPEIAPLKKEMALLFERNPEVAALAEKKASIPIPLISGMQSQGLKQAIAGGQSRGGDLLNKLNQGVTSQTTGARLGRNLAGQAGRRVVADAFGLRQGEPTVPEPGVEGAATGTPEGLLTGAVGDSSEGLTPEAMLAGGESTAAVSPAQQYYEAAQRAIEAGDPTAAGQLLDFAKQYAALDESMMDSGTGLSATQQKEAGKLSGAATSVDAIEQLFDQAGGGQGRIAGTVSQAIGGLTGSGDVYNYEEFRRSQIAPLARAISGEVGTLTDADISRAEGLLPRINEDSAAAKRKFQTIRQLINARQQNVQQNPGAAGTDILEQLNAAY